MATPTAANNGDKLYSALVNDQKETVTLLELAADAGHAEAQYTLGKMHRAGKGVARNDAKALHYFQMAASQGHKKALTNVGVMYETGRGVVKNPKNAAKYYAKAAKAGDAKAAFNLSVLYKSGAAGVEKNSESAAHFLRVAAENGSEKAQYNMGVQMLRSADDGDEDAKVEAEKWLEKAAENKAGKAHYTLGVVAEQKMQEGKISEEDVTARFKSAAENGHAPSMFVMGKRWLSGKGVPRKDPSKAAEYFRRGMDSGDAKSACNLGVMYEAGRGVRRSVKDALACYEAGAKLGDCRSAFNAAKMYRKGVPGCVDVNAELAYEYYKLSADKGYKKAQYNLAMMILKGETKGAQEEDEEKSDEEGKEALGPEVFRTRASRVQRRKNATLSAKVAAQTCRTPSNFWSGRPKSITIPKLC